jgi:hypothetical protein
MPHHRWPTTHASTVPKADPVQPPQSSDLSTHPHPPPATWLLQNLACVLQGSGAGSLAAKRLAAIGLKIDIFRSAFFNFLPHDWPVSPATRTHYAEDITQKSTPPGIDAFGVGWSQEDKMENNTFGWLSVTWNHGDHLPRRRSSRPTGASRGCHETRRVRPLPRRLTYWSKSHPNPPPSSQPSTYRAAFASQPASKTKWCVAHC